MSSGCGCKEVYRFPHITYPYSSRICSFFAAASQLYFFFYIMQIPHSLLLDKFNHRFGRLDK